MAMAALPPSAWDKEKFQVKPWSSIAFADPDHGFTCAIFLNGRVPETEHQPRMRTILDQLRSELVSG